MLNALKSQLINASAAIILCSPVLAQAAQIYSNDFSAGVGAEWTTTNSSTNAAGVLGYLSGGSATLSITSPVAGAGVLSFDLLGFLSLDGAGNCCTDTFNLSINSQNLFTGNYNMGGGGADVTVTAPTGTIVITNPGNSPGVVTSLGGITHIDIPFLLIAGLNSFTFDYGQLQGISDEGWGLDNVNITTTATPIPAPIWLFGSALIGLIGFSRHNSSLFTRKA